MKNTKLQNQIMYLKEKNYKRNYIALMLEGFFFTFALSIFSHTTVLPVYISNISNNSIYVSMLAIIFFGLSYGSSIFSCILGVNAKSTKWLTVCICALQRLGMLLIFLSTFVITDKLVSSLIIFFIAYSVFSISVGLSSPVYSNMISKVIHRNVSNFYGSYTLAGAVSGVLGSQFIRVLLGKYGFPINYRALFLLGLISALLSLMMIIIFVTEIPTREIESKIGFKDLPKIFKETITENLNFKKFMIIRVFIAMAEMSVPFYIIKISSMSNVSESFVGNMSTILLLSNIIFSKILGYIGNKYGPYFLLIIGGAAGVLSTGISLVIPNYNWGYILFVLVSITTLSVTMSTRIANIMYSKKGFVPIYTAMSGFIIAPFYTVFSLFGGLMVNYFSLEVVFLFSLVLYAASIFLNMTARTVRLNRKVRAVVTED